MSSVVEAYRYDQSGAQPFEEEKQPAISVPDTSGPPMSASMEVSQERPYTQAQPSKRFHSLMQSHKSPNSVTSTGQQRGKTREMIRAIEKKEEVVRAQRQVLSKMFGKLSNFERTLRITRNIVKKLKNRLLEAGVPLPDVDDETADQLYANGTVQDKLEEALIGYQNITPAKHTKRQSTDTSFEPTPFLSEYDRFVLKQLEKAELRALPAMRRMEYSDTIPERRIKPRSDQDEDEGKPEPRVRKMSKNRSNLKQRAVSTGRSGVEKLPRLKKPLDTSANTTFSPSSTLLDPGVAPPSLKKAIGPVKAYRPVTSAQLSSLRKTSELYYKIDSKFRDYMSHKLLITLSDANLVKSEMQALSTYFVARGAKENFFHKTRGLLFDTLALFFLVRNVASNNKMEVYLPRMVQMLAEVVEAERCAIYLYDKINDELYCRVITGSVETAGGNLGDISIKRSKGVHGQAFSTGTPIYLKNAYADPKFDSTLDQKLNFVSRNVLVVPIVFGNKAIGVLEVTNKMNSIDFTECDLALLKQITSETAIGITAFQMKQNIVSRSNTRQQKEFEEEIAQVKGLVGESHNRLLKPLTSKLAKIAKEGFECDHAVIYYHDAKTSQFWTYSQTTVEGDKDLEQIETHFDDKKGFAGQVLKTRGRPLLDMNPLESQLYYKEELAHLQMGEMNSLLAYPVFDRTSSRIIAILELINLPKFTIVNNDGSSKIKFSQGSQQLLKCFCSYISELHFTSDSLAGTMMSNDLNDLLLQALNEGVIVLNLKGTVTRVNRSVSLLFEKDSNELVGSSLEELFGAQNSVIVEVYNEALMKQTTAVREMCGLVKPRHSSYSSKDEPYQVIYANVSCVNVNASRNHLFGYVVLIQPVLKPHKYKPEIVNQEAQRLQLPNL